MGKELFETLPDVLDAKLLASALSISKAGAYQLLNRPDFPTLQEGGNLSQSRSWLCGWNSIQIQQNRREPERRKKQMKLTKYEQETIINFNNDEQEASIYTASPQMMRKLDALAAAYPEHYRVVGQTEVSKTYSCEKHLINLRKPRKQNEEHSQWARQRMQKMNRHKNAGNL